MDLRESNLTELPKPRAFSQVLWIVGGICGPILCLSVELSTRMCRNVLFDPLPTPWHVALILTVPAATLLGMRALRVPAMRQRWLGVLLGCATCTTLLYAPPFLLLFPLSILMLLGGVGLLSLAPLLATVAMLTMAADFRVRAGDPGGRRLPGTWTGFFGCIALLVLIDVGSLRTIMKVREQWVNLNDSGSAEWLRNHGDRGMLEELASGRQSLRPIVFFVRRSDLFDAQFVRDHWREFTGEAPPESLRLRWED